MPRERMITVIKVSISREPPRYMAQPAGRMVISVVGASVREMDTGSWQLFIH